MNPSSRHLSRTVVAGVLALGTSVVLTASLPAGAAEIGPDDFQVSQSVIDHREPEVAYNATDNEYLAVWSALVGGESQIYGRRISAAGAPIGNEFPIAAINQGDITTNADEPDVVWNSVDNEYVVVFEGDDTVDASGSFVTTLEIYAVEVTAAGVPGTPVEISDAGDSDADGGRDANEPAITHNPDANEYFVVWDADDDGSLLANNEFEIFGQRLTNNLAEVGADTRYSDVGPDATGAHDADSPAVAYLGGEYLIVFEADDAVDNLHEIHGQHVDAATGAELGTNDFIVSVGTANEEAREPEIAANPDNNDFMVTWIDTDDSGGGNFDVEVHGAYVAAIGGTTSTFAISSNGAGPTFSLDTVDISYHPDTMLHSIAWAGEQTGVTGPDEYEVFHTYWNPDTSAVVGTIDRITNNGVDGVADTTVERPSIAAGPDGTAAVVYDAGSPSTVFGQLVGQDADLSVTKTLTTPTNPGPGDTVTYTIAYGNNGPGDATDVTITDVVPAGLDYSSASPVPSSIIGDTLTWNVASIASGGSGSITLDLIVDGTAVDGQTITNTASISSTGPTADPVSANDTGSAAAINVDFPPSVTIEQGGTQADPTTAGPIVFDVTFSEDVTGFDDGATDVVIGGTAPGTLSAVITQDTGSSYTVTVSGMTGDGIVTATIPGAAAIDSSSKPNAASTSTDNEVTYDATAPTVTVEQAVGQVDPTGGSPVNFTATFSEDVVGFVDADVTLGGTAGATTVVVTGGPAVYNIAVSGMTGDGTVTASIDAGAASDAAGNANTASTSTDNEVTYDPTAPTVTIEQGAAQIDSANAEPIVFDVVFSEPVSGFGGADVSLSGTAGATTAVVAGAGGTYTVSVTGMTGNGTVVAAVVAAAAQDAAGNDSEASTSVDNLVTYIAGDVTPGVNDPPVVKAPATVSVELAEARAFTGADAVSVVDPDALDNEIVVTLTADDAETVISVVATAGVTITGDGTDAVTLTGPQSGINASLAGLEIAVNNTGDTTVAVAADDQGNTDAGGPLTDSADIVITAVDTTTPTITVPVGGVTASNDPGQAGAVVDFTVTVDDPGSLPAGRLIELQASPSLTCTPASGSFFPIGETTVGCTATDASGNSATESFVVTVTDDEDPVISGAVDQTVTPPSAGAQVSFVEPTATDNSGSATVTCSPASGSATWAGARTVTCTATDAADNTAASSFTVTANVARIPDTGGSLTLLPWAVVLLFFGSVLFGATAVKRRHGTTG